MCGIAGLKRFTAPVTAADVATIQQYTVDLFHRGPDCAQVVPVGARTVLGSTRLRITDAHNPAADMPFVSLDGQRAIVFNGEIYNHRALRTELANYPYRTESDTETLLAAYEAWGHSLLDHIDGMFAFCIYDNVTESLFLAVDPLGQKPLYYAEPADTFRFASELTALLHDTGFTKTWNRDGISEILAQRFTVGGDTHISEINKLDAGCFLTVSARGTEKRRYFQLDLSTGLTDENEASYLLREAFRESIGSMADLEVSGGVFLSGGLDSSSVLAGLCERQVRLPTFSVGFEPIADQPTFSSAIAIDEFSFTEQLSSNFGLTNQRERLCPDRFFSSWDAWTGLMDEPLCFNETAAHLSLFNAVQGSARVIFSGSGADEMFDGYGFGAQLEHSGCTPDGIASSYFDLFNYSFGCDTAQLLVDTGTKDRVLKKLNAYIDPYTAQTDSTLQLVQALMVHARLPHSEFRQLDRASMAHSIEARLPFANRAFIQAAFAVDPALKAKQGISKYIFREAMRPLLPEYIYSRPKVPFAPIGELFFTEQFAVRLQELFADNSVLAALGVVDMDYVYGLASSADPAARPILSNLVLLNRVLERQSACVQ